jgi:cholesterol transport system auxiliary component
MSRTLLVVSVIALAGCHFLGTHDTAKTGFDFGLPETRESRSVPKTLPANLVVANIMSPGWMDNSSMYYRLTYRNAANPLPYANSQWVMSPAALLTQRLRWTLGAGNEGDSTSGGATRAAYILRGELVEFEQIFDQPDRSRGVLRLRATLEAQRDGSRTQRTFEIEKSAPTPDAVGGVKALSQCAAELADSVAEWVVDKMRTATAGEP